jgi:hypothetical protein
MKKLLAIIALIIPLLLSQNSWGSSLPECEGSPLSGSNWIDLFDWDNCQGTVTFPSGEQYVGEYKDGETNGQGTYTFPDGEQYVGEWKDSKRHGQGTFTFLSGAKYVGEYKDDLRNGQGTYTFLSGAKYVGEFKDGKEHGQGTYTFPDGTKEEGIHKDGEFLYENIVTSKDDENFCLEIGFKRSTPEFDNCVEKTAEKD